MNLQTVVQIQWVIQIAVLISLGVILYSFIFMIARWRTPRRRRHAITLLVSIVAIPCLISGQFALMTWGLAAVGRQQAAESALLREAQGNERAVVHPGDPAPDFFVTDIDGAEFSLAGARGKVVLINFFATWCGPCMFELPHIQKIWEEHRDNQNFELVVIGREETSESVTQFRTKNGYTFPMAADPERATYSKYAKEFIPRTILVSPDGTILLSLSGYNEQDLDKLKSLLSEHLEQAE